MFSRVGAIVFKELKQLSRDRMTFGMIVMIPMMQLLLFGYAINTDVRHLPVGLINLSQSSQSRDLVAALEASGAVRFKQVYASKAEAEKAITLGESKAVLYIPADFPQRLFSHPNYPGNNNRAAWSHSDPQQPIAQWMVDGSDTMVAASIKALRNFPLAEITGQAYQANPAVLEVVQYFNPEQRSAVNVVPGLLAIILTMTMIMFTAAAIVREREQGNMEFLINTPVQPMELMFGKIVPYVLVGLIQVSIILGIGHVIFHVPVRGGLLTLFAAALLFIFASLTVGMVISTLVKTQLQAMQMTVFILMPSILLSGFMFPYEAMPAPAQYIAEVLPATHFMRLVRGIVLRDASLTGQTFDMVWLLVFTLLGLMFASLRFKKRLD
ncbi:MAG: ABC transporter permease [Oceanospirillaceae bacterium]|nr:ABC transporter permease [Oceanospirillaceae bacterium]MCP5351237.1 ABC transporter permease [Oceanospirillaceae bacterium]